MPEVLMVGTSDVYAENEQPVETSTSGVAWPAIIGGAFAAIALTLILSGSRIASGPSFGVAVAQLRSVGGDVHSYDRRVADRDAMAGIGPGRLPHRPTEDQVGWPAHA